MRRLPFFLSRPTGKRRTEDGPVGCTITRRRLLLVCSMTQGKTELFEVSVTVPISTGCSEDFDETASIISTSDSSHDKESLESKPLKKKNRRKPSFHFKAVKKQHRPGSNIPRQQLPQSPLNIDGSLAYEPGSLFLSFPCTFTEVQNTIETEIFPSSPILYLSITTNNHCDDDIGDANLDLVKRRNKTERESELDRTDCWFKGISYQAIPSDVSAQSTSETEQMQANTIIPQRPAETLQILPAPNRTHTQEVSVCDKKATTPRRNVHWRTGGLFAVSPDVDGEFVKITLTTKADA